MISRRSMLACLATAALSRNAHAGARKVNVQSDLAKRFADVGTSGTFVAMKADGNALIASDDTRCRAAILPASTFKIPHSLIALDTGVVADPDKDVFKWNGTHYAIEAWNRDHTLRSAIAASAVPVYQQIAKRIGAEREQKYLDLLNYGNRNISGGIEHFWLNGGLRISPLQQVDFLARLVRGDLPVSKRAQDLTRDIVPVTQQGDTAIHNKTGLIGVDEATARQGITASVGWIVGWASRGDSTTLFALNMDIRKPENVAARMTVAQQCLGDIGAI